MVKCSRILDGRSKAQSRLGAGSASWLASSVGRGIASARLALARAYERLGNRRRNFCHQVSKWLIEKYDLIALEKLNIAGMVRGNFPKSILDAAWGELLGQLAYKAEEAGKFVVAVAPHGTSQICSNCGAVVAKGIEERRHECNQCGLSLSRDHNAALNILALGRSAVGLAPPEVRN
jgi:putative transposase